MKKKKALSYMMALTMGLSLFAGMTFTVSAETLDSNADTDTVSADETLSELYDNYSTGYDENGDPDTSVYDYAEDSLSDNVNTLSDEEFDSAFDLRHVGGTVTYNEETKQSEITGGKSYVTSVKNQNPWGDCWAFGTIAACETSILYDEGAGTETEDNDLLDLSELHLAWFATNHIPAEGEEGYGVNDVNNQDGEGFYYTSDIGSKSIEGGMPFYGAVAFSSGMGVVSENVAPYIGKAKKVTALRKAGADTTKYPNRFLYYNSKEEWEALQDQGIKENYFLFCYSSDDDWSLDESLRFNSEYEIEESNILPSVNGIVDEATGKVTLNEDGVNAIKSELQAGRAVAIGYCSDTSKPSQDTTNSIYRYMNSNSAHYCWDSKGISHCVCIVGWDDDYDASNFGQDNPVKWNSDGDPIYKLKDSDQELKYNEDGTLYYVDDKGETHTYTIYSDEVETVTEENGRALSTPPGNGAWIVKNSWGSVNGEFPEYNDWGVDGSGYFYLSYYDTSIQSCETYDFDVESTDETEDTIIDQYDYLASGTTSQSESYSPVSMANVFTASEDMEVTDVSCQTTTPGTKVKYAVCVLDDEEDYPSFDEIEFSEPVEYTYGGYHKYELEKPVIVAKGQKYAVIVQEYYTASMQGMSFDKYCICSNIFLNKEYVVQAQQGNRYGVGVINQGESYIGIAGYNSTDSKWVDYNDFLSAYPIKDKTGESGITVSDNFSIKAYGKSTTKAAPVLDSAVNTKTGVKVSWESKGSDVTYRVFYRKAGTTKWTAFTDTTETSCVVTGLKSGVSYEFTVRCPDDSGIGYSTLYDKDGISCTYLSYVKPKATIASKAIMISWSKSAGASGYKIYRKTGTSSYELIGIIYKNNRFTFKDTTAVKGQTYTYKVKAFKNGKKSAGKAVKCKLK